METSFFVKNIDAIIPLIGGILIWTYPHLFVNKNKPHTEDTKSKYRKSGLTLIAISIAFFIINAL